MSRAADLSAAIDVTAMLEGGTVAIDGTLAAPEAGGGPLTQAFDGTVDADLADLSVLSGLAGRPLGGALDATATGTVRGDLALLDLTVDATGTDLALGLPEVDPLLRGATRVAGTVAAPRTARRPWTSTPRWPPGTASVDRHARPRRRGLGLHRRRRGGPARPRAALRARRAAARRRADGHRLRDRSARPHGPRHHLRRDQPRPAHRHRAGSTRSSPGAGTVSGQVERSPEGGIALALVADTPLLDADVAGTFMDDAGNARFDVSVAEVASLLPGLSGPASAVGTATRAADGTITVDADATAPGAAAQRAGNRRAAGRRATASRARPTSRSPTSPPTARWSGSPSRAASTRRSRARSCPRSTASTSAIDATATNLSPGDPTLAALLAGTGTVTGRVVRDEGGLAARGPAGALPEPLGRRRRDAGGRHHRHDLRRAPRRRGPLHRRHLGPGDGHRHAPPSPAGPRRSTPT